MFIRQYKIKNKKTGKIYIKHQLVQSYRTESGPRQRVVMNLGKLDLDKSEWRRFAFALEERLSGQQSLIKEPEITSEVQRVFKNYNFYKLKEKREAQNIAKRFRKHGKAYFEFITTPGIEPTNNTAEQAVRFVVIDRHITQGTRSVKGRQSNERL